jgi:hypothetical protein
LAGGQADIPAGGRSGGPGKVFHSKFIGIPGLWVQLRIQYDPGWRVRG